MNIGYACLTVGVPNTNFRTCRKSKATEENLRDLIALHLNSLNNMLDYAIEEGISLLRLSSEVIPFGSHPVNTLKWWELFERDLRLLGEKARKNNLRLSMHPGQYTVLNSIHRDVVERSVKDLRYHGRFLDALGLGPECKIILHVGGAYGDKPKALREFGKNYESLDRSIKDRLAIENDDRIFTIGEVLQLGEEYGIPVVYDNLHNAVNPCGNQNDSYWIARVGRTWQEKDGNQKIHYSQQGKGKKPGGHSDTIDLEEFLKFIDTLGDLQGAPDIMLEVKDKNLSCVKCINAVNRQSNKYLEREWARYKYLILEHSPKAYREIRELLKDKKSYPVVDFYRRIDDALSQEVTSGNAVNAGEHLWGYFKGTEEKETREKVRRELEKVKKRPSSLGLKRLLWTCVEKKDEEYLKNSLYFKDVL